MNYIITYIFINQILISLLIISKSLAYLNYDQTILINKLIQNKNTTPKMRIYINQIIYHNYKNKTYLDANLFYRENYKIIKTKKHILNLYAQTGLVKSIEKFNGRSNFYNYSKIYIRSEMLKCISDYNSNNLPHRIKTSNKIPKYIKKHYDIISAGSLDEWKFDKASALSYNKYNYFDSNHLNNNHFNINDKLLQINLILQKLEPRVKRTFNYRYNYDLKTIRSINDVSELMCWSTETTRKVLINAFIQIRKELVNNQLLD
jgi:hypothetical protein